MKLKPPASEDIVGHIRHLAVGGVGQAVNYLVKHVLNLAAEHRLHHEVEVGVEVDGEIGLAGEGISSKLSFSENHKTKMVKENTNKILNR